MKKRIAYFITAVLLMNSLIFSASAGSIFPDMSDDASYAEAVQYAKEKGIFNGDSNGYFNPDSSIIRAEFATIICRLLASETTAKSLSSTGFTDVPSNHWASGYIKWAVEHGMVAGYGNGKYGPSDPVTYEQAIKMLICAFNCGDMATDAGGYPYGYINVANQLGILEGIDRSVGEAIPRSDIAILLYNISNVNFG